MYERGWFKKRLCSISPKAHWQFPSRCVPRASKAGVDSHEHSFAHWRRPAKRERSRERRSSSVETLARKEMASISAVRPTISVLIRFNGGVERKSPPPYQPWGQNPPNDTTADNPLTTVEVSGELFQLRSNRRTTKLRGFSLPFNVSLSLSLSEMFKHP